MQIPFIIKKYRRNILFAILLVITEKVAWIIEPSVFGDVIDAMIESLSVPPKGSPVIPLLIWIGIFSINSGVGAIRRIRDEKIYLNIYGDIAESIALVAKEKGISPAKATARAELSREYISFFQYRFPEMIEQAIDIFGAAIALAFYDWRLSITCLSIAIPMTFIRRIYYRKISIFQKNVHDQREDIYEVFKSADRKQVKSYYKDLAYWQQRIANWGALNFVVVRIFLLGIFVVVLYIAIDLDDFSTGNIYSIAAYVWTFVTSSEYLPEQMESWTSLKDISRRITVENI